MSARDAGEPSLVTGTGTVKSRPCYLRGFYVNSTTAGTLVLHDATAATNAVTGTITPAIGWHELPLAFGVGLHVVVGGTISVTFSIYPG